MSKNNLIIAFSVVLIAILSIGGFLVFNSNSTKKAENNYSNSNLQNSPKTATEFVKNNDTNDIKINETRTINPKFASSETKEKYGVEFDPCKMLTPEMTEKYFGFKFEKSEIIPLEKGSISCKFSNKEKTISIQTNDYKILGDDRFKFDKLNLPLLTEDMKFLAYGEKDSTGRKVISTQDNSILLALVQLPKTTTSTATFMISKYKIIIGTNQIKNPEKFENFVKEFYENVKF